MFVWLAVRVELVLPVPTRKKPKGPTPSVQFPFDITQVSSVGSTVAGSLHQSAVLNRAVFTQSITNLSLSRCKTILAVLMM